MASSLCLLLAIVSGGVAAKSWRNYTPQNRTPLTCPDYGEYARTRHEPFSSGSLGLPNMRPSPECRTFNSSAVERVISDMQSRLKDPDLAAMFANTFPSTLDTTVEYFDPDVNLAFIVTGDITAQWLRDTGNQFAHLYKLLPWDRELQALVKAVINTESRYIAQYPYCGSFQPPPESGLAPSVNSYAIGATVYPPVNNQTVFECKHELDSLSAFLKITRSYYANTKDSSFLNANWIAAADAIFRVLSEQAQSTWDAQWNFVSYYSWMSSGGSIPNSGNGQPKLANGLVASSYRPSDDQVILPFITSDNAMMSVELDHLASILNSIGVLPNISSLARNVSSTIRQAIWENTVLTTTAADGKIFAYETDGYGGVVIMDDANVPSLVSLPYLGFLPRSDPTYVATKKAMFSRRNPYFAAGPGFQGIGGPHVNATYVWPMSHVSAIFGSDDDVEIADRLKLLLNSTAGLGLMHESVQIYEKGAKEYTRPWFAWANSYFAEMVLDLAERKPGLVFGEGSGPYVIGH